MKTAVFRHSIFFKGRKTSVSLEDEFWNGLREISVYKKMSVPKLVEQIDDTRKIINLSSAIRLFVLIIFMTLPENESVVRPGEVGTHDGGTVSPLAECVRGFRFIFESAASIYEVRGDAHVLWEQLYFAIREPLLSLLAPFYFCTRSAIQLR